MAWAKWIGGGLLWMSSALSLMAGEVPAGLRLPPGFSLSVFSDQVPGAREIALGDRGTVFVGSMAPGKVYALTDRDGDGRAERVQVIASGLEMPVGVAFHQGDLYIAAVRRIVVLRNIEQHLDAPPPPQLVTDQLPYRSGDHAWKFIAFGPDGKLYVPIGAPCNLCEVGKDYGKLIRMQADGSGIEDVAYGIRNSVGFTWRPGSNQLWFTDNGRDLLGDDQPSDELNRLSRPGEHFGYPYCHQGDLADPQLGRGRACADYTPPVLKLGAHVAALGLRFYQGGPFPVADRGALIIAEHGSWNRTEKAGYRVMLVRLKGNQVAAYEPLVEGFQRDGKTLGRPVDVQPLADGSVLISDDFAGAIYRLRYARP